MRQAAWFDWEIQPPVFLRLPHRTGLVLLQTRTAESQEAAQRASTSLLADSSARSSMDSKGFPGVGTYTSFFVASVVHSHQPDFES
jgi:hypothetical protein